MRKTDLATRVALARAGRWLVQLSFLLLFLHPLGVALYRRASMAPAPVFTSWLLPFDPLAGFGAALGRGLALIIAGPLLLLAASLIVGRSFCGWVCPLGTLFDLLRPLAFWRKRKPLRPVRGLFPPNRNSTLRYALLAVILGASLYSLRYLGLFDPLVIFHRASTSLAGLIAGPRAAWVAAGAALLLALTGLVVLEWWQPRFWCRNLCPFGALLGLVSRFSLLRHHVNPITCTHCRQCERACPMNALSSGVDTPDYSQCTFCLECTAACPQDGIYFDFHRGERSQAQAGAPSASRRAFLRTAGAAVLGAALIPLAEAAPKKPVLRPPGALPENEFLRACILCQECIRVCPTGGLRPALLESGLAGLGTPVLVPRQGGCALNPSCPDLCAKACPVGAILPVTREEMHIGIARVQRDACLAWDQGAKCLVCVEACLNSAAVAYHGRVTVDPNRCTGCGRCESGCPVPGSAIRVEPVDIPRG